MLRRALDALETVRAGSIARKLQRHLTPGETLLDLGCGSLIVGDILEKTCGVRVFGVDPLVFRRRPLPLAVASGDRAPFRDGAFDAVLLAFVLHHVEDGGLGVLREAKRVARSRILLLEDGYDGPWERRLIRILDRVLNRLEDPRIRVPLRFRSTPQWLEAFGALGLRAAAVRSIRTTPLVRTRQVLFVLEAV